MLVVLQRLVGEAADQSETANLERTGCERAASLGAEHNRTQAAGCSASAQLVLGDQVLQLIEQIVRRMAGRLADRFAGMARGAGRLVGSVRFRVLFL